MTPESPFLLSIAALSASLAGLAGLVAALRRGEGLSTYDRYRLHQIVEFCFANILLTVSMIPLTTLTGSPETCVRIGGATVVIYIVAAIIVLTRRSRELGITWHRSWLVIVGSLDLTAIALATSALLTGSLGAFQATLVILLARPMVAFLFVLSSFEQGAERPPSA